MFQRATAITAFLLVNMAFADDRVMRRPAVIKPGEKDVLVLTERNFESTVSSFENLLVFFYDPWCSHCSLLAPEFANAAKYLTESKSLFKLGKLDATVECDLAQKLGIYDYPTLKLFKNGKQVDYTGGETRDKIIEWVLKKSGQVAKLLQSEDELKLFIEKKELAIVGYFENIESVAAKLYLEMAEADDDHSFGLVLDNSKFSDSKLKDTFVLYKNLDEKNVTYDNKISNIKDIKTFVFVHSMPLIIEYNQDIDQKIFNPLMKNFLLMFLSKKQGHFIDYLKDMESVAIDFRGKIVFVTINTDERENQSILDFYGLKENDVPCMRGIKLEQDITKFKPRFPSLSEDDIRYFVYDVVEETVKPYLLSEELPEDWDKTAVWTLTASNFDSVVLDSSKHVLVEFYTPCKQFYNLDLLAPIYYRVGQYFADEDDIIIAKIDVSANELEHTRIFNPPKLIFYSKGDNPKVIEYNGDLTVKAIIEFVKAEVDQFEDEEEYECEGFEEEAKYEFCNGM